MPRWTLLRQRATLVRWSGHAPSTKRSLPIKGASVNGVRMFTKNTIHQQVDGRPSSPATPRIQPHNLDSIGRQHRTDAWLALIEPSLPPHIQRPSHIGTGPALNPDELIDVLLSAEKASLHDFGRDILSYIALENGRWDFAVALVKHLVDLFATSPDTSLSTALLCTWKNDTSLDELTRAPVDTLDDGFLQQVPLVQHHEISLAQVTTTRKDDKEAQDAARKHHVLGMIWRGLGNMTLACGEAEIKPEILEIIAFLHHQGFMPSSIYDSKPSSDSTAIQQSPILNLLSSRILTSLGDAAWRAHEKFIVEDAKRKGGEYASLRPEIPGMGYRVRVTGLKPEVWLELILWSCLHGGWISEGLRILEKLHGTREPCQWRPLSWRSLVSDQPTDTRDWEKVEYLFNNWAASSMDLEEPLDPMSVRRTVSSEIVNAYVDASISVMRLSDGGQGRSVSRTIAFMTAMQQFLGRSGLSLGAGSWDAIVLRLFDLQATDASYRPWIFDNVIQLSPAMGQETAASNVKSLPEYVFDGTAAVFGLFHRALYHRIKDADVEGTLRLFASLQERADENKRQSVADFLQKQALFSQADDAPNAGQFTGNYNSIDYPAFYVQIPATILGPFLELVIDAKAYEFGKWLLYSEEVDGPIIPEEMYADEAITPALARFAAETGDKALLSRLIKIRASSANRDGPSLPRKVLQSFLESQINVMRWNAAIKILQYTKDTYGMSWNIVTLCHLLRVSLLQLRLAQAGDEKARENYVRARGIFRQLVRGVFERDNERPDFVQEQVDNLLVVLASIGREWTGFSINTQAVKGYRVFNLSSKAFNIVLEGVVDAYGSQAGRRLIGLFWSHQVRSAQANESESDRYATDPPFSSFGQTLSSHIRQQRTEIRLPGSAARKVVMYAGLHPDLMTIRIVLKKAVEELVHAGYSGDSFVETSSAFASSAGSLAEAELDELDNHQDHRVDLSPIGMLVWAAKCLRRLGMRVDDITEELRQGLPESTLKQILTRLPDLLTQPEEQPEQDDRTSEDEGGPTKAMR